MAPSVPAVERLGSTPGLDRGMVATVALAALAALEAKEALVAMADRSRYRPTWWHRSTLGRSLSISIRPQVAQVAIQGMQGNLGQQEGWAAAIPVEAAALRV